MKKYDVSFGIALQLVNIIKDVREDSLRKVCFIPEEICRKYGFNHSYDMFSTDASEENRARVMLELVDSAWKHLHDAVQYVLLIPRVNVRIRLFCLWPLFMAAENLVVIGDAKTLFNAEKKRKITRNTVQKIIRSTLFHFYSNKWILSHFESIRARA
jgi:farnesyl-diphosphate farnesyltransferase